VLIGKVVKSNSHIDYVCRVYGPGEVPQPPTPEDCAFGTFVRMGLSDSKWLIGIIYNTMLYDPDFGTLGPRLSPQPEQGVFYPDYLNEKATLVGIAAIGTMWASGNVLQGVPAIATSTDAPVEQLTDDQIRSFHQGTNPLQLAYAPLLLAQNAALTLHLLRQVVTRLMTLFPEQIAILSVLQDDLTWKSQVLPLGGA